MKKASEQVMCTKLCSMTTEEKKSKIPQSSIDKKETYQKNGIIVEKKTINITIRNEN